MGPKISMARYALITFLVAVFLVGIYIILSGGKSKKTVATVTQIPSTIAAPVVTTTAPSTVAPTMEVDIEYEDDDLSSHASDEEDEEDDLLDVLMEEDVPEDVQDDDLMQPDNENDVGSSPATDPSQCPDLLIRQGNSLLLYNSKMPKKDGENPIHFNSLDDYIYYIKVQRYTKNQYCPVLYLQQENDAQGNDVYRVRPGPFNQQAGLPVVTNAPQLPGTVQQPTGLGARPVPPVPFNQAATAKSLNKPGSSVQVLQQGLAKHPSLVPYVDANHQAPFNQGYYGFDPTSQYVGKHTILDQIHNSTKSQHPKTGLSSNPMDPNWAGIIFMNQPTNSPTNVSFAPYSQNAGPNVSALDYSNVSPGSAPAPTTLPPGKDDPMNVNWVGVQASRADVNAGAYANDNVLIRTA